MARSLIFAILLIVLGVVTTIAVAWGYAGIGHPEHGRNRFSTWSEERHSIGNGWEIWEWGGNGKRALMFRPERKEERWRRFHPFDPPSWSAASRPVAEAEGLVDGASTIDGTWDWEGTLFEDARGWPFLSLYCYWPQLKHEFLTPGEFVRGGLGVEALRLEWIIEYDESDEYGGIFYGADEMYASIDERRALPLIPIWSGFIGSTAVYGVGWFLVILTLSSPAALRRWLRRRRTRCVRCAYSLVGIDSTRCPECGWTIGHRTRFLTGGRFAIAAVAAVLMTASVTAFAVFLVKRLDGPDRMFVAARYGDTDAIAAMIAAGADVDQPFDAEWLDYGLLEGTTPLMWASAHGHVDVTRQLLKAGADPLVINRSNNSALCNAAEYGHVGVVAALLDAGVSVNLVLPPQGRIRLDTPLIRACSNGWFDVVKLLIERGADVKLGTDEYGYTAIFGAARLADDTILRFLIAHGADFDANEENGWKDVPLYAAARAGSEANVAALIEAGADVNPAVYEIPINGAVWGDNLGTVKSLLKAGASVVGPYVGAVLWQAAEDNHTEMARVLIEAGADPNVKSSDIWDWTPLMRAVTRANLDITRMLIEAGAYPSTRDSEGQSIFFYIRWDDASEDLLDYLFSLGLDVDRASDRGNTPLMNAVAFDKVRGVRRLLAEGADPTVTNVQGHSALDYARTSLPYTWWYIEHQRDGDTDPEIMRLLQEYSER